MSLETVERVADRLLASDMRRGLGLDLDFPTLIRYGTGVDVEGR